MTDDDEGDRLMTLIVVGLLVFLVIGFGVLILTASYVQEESGAAPEADWNLTRINESYVRITHSGGEAVPLDSLSVTVDGVPAKPRWSASSLTNGEFGVVRVGQGNRLTLLWRHTERDRDVLRQWTLTTPSAGN